MIRIVPVSEAKRRILELVEEAEQDDAIFYVTHSSHPKAVVIGAPQYEALLRKVNHLETGLAKLWLSLNEQDEGLLMIPIPDGGWQPLKPNTRE